jgi:hypothetical protein
MLGELFRCYSGYVISRWWDLRISPGSVGGCITDISVIIHDYLGWLPEETVSSYPAEIHEIVNKLKVAYAFRLGE